MRAAVLGFLGLASACASDASLPLLDRDTDLSNPLDPSAPGTDPNDPGLAPTFPSGSSAVCPVTPACDLAPPTETATFTWHGGWATTFMVLQGEPNHRGRDLIVREGEPQWAIAKFSYGNFIDKDLEGEDVDVYVLRDCAAWEFLGTGTTTADGQHEVIEGVPSSPGRLYFQVPADRLLGVGIHRFHFVVRGDASSTDAYVQVVRSDARIVVSDVDGTLTNGENSEAISVFLDTDVEANAGAAQAMRTLQDLGYVIFYLTARPEWEQPNTHAWLAANGFPTGVVHTTFDTIPLIGANAADFKTNELVTLSYRLGHAPDFAFGNKDTDLTAYLAAGVPQGQTYLYQYAGDPMGARVFDDYSEIVPELEALAAVCQ